MPFMVSVNRFIWRFGIPALLLAYAGYLVWGYTQQTDGGRTAIIRQHLSNLQAMDHVDGLVLGGSNAVFSLSAAQLDELSGMTWYNASLMNEGYTDSNYRRFVTRVAETVDPNAIKLVVYSTVSPLRAHEFDRRKNFKGDVTGHLPLSIKPSRSALDYFIQSAFEGGVSKSKDYPLPTRDGDIDFSHVDCGDLPSEGQFFEWEDVTLSAHMIAIQTAFLESMFPKAKVMIVLPSEYYSRPEDLEKRKELVDSLFDQVTREFDGMAGIDASRVSLMEQSPYPVFGYVCDSRHHANQIGRAFRTQDLFVRLDAS